MSQSHHESDLPYVDDDVLLSMVHDELEDPQHVERWNRFAHEQPLLAIEMAKRAFLSIQAIPAEQANRQELRRIVLNEVTYVFEAMARAMQLKAEDDEDQPPAATDPIAS